MSKSAIQRLDVDAKIRKRAQWEAFEFTLLDGGKVEVQNGSYPDDDEDDHTYIVEVEDGEPTTCDCPYGEYHEGACKHQVAVAIRTPLIAALIESEGPRLATDGGALTTDVKPEEDTCPNGDPRCDGPDGDGLSCFPCFEIEEAS